MKSNPILDKDKAQSGVKPMPMQKKAGGVFKKKAKKSAPKGAMYGC